MKGGELETYAQRLLLKDFCSKTYIHFETPTILSTYIESLGYILIQVPVDQKSFSYSKQGGIRITWQQIRLSFSVFSVVLKLAQLGSITVSEFSLLLLQNQS